MFVAYESSSSGLTLVQQRSPVVKVFAYCKVNHKKSSDFDV